jgi:uncharacterized phage-associated protein
LVIASVKVLGNGAGELITPANIFKHTVDIKLPCIAVANWFIKASWKDGQSINVIKVQRLAYFAHCWSLAIYGAPLTREHVEAWSYGPVFSDIYHAALKYGAEPIGSLLEVHFRNMLPPDESHPALPLLIKIWNVYGSYTSQQLCNVANKGDGPWAKTLEKNPGRKNTQINENDIREYFLSFAISGKEVD